MIWKYILVSILQGVVEWLPISSEGVSTLTAQFLNLTNPLDLALFLHLGTAGAAFLFFWKDWKKVLILRDKKLLKFLLINLNKVLTRDLLLEKIWEYDYAGDTRTVDVHIRRLRTKIEEDPSNPQYIMTVRGKGYKFKNPGGES